MPTETEPLSQLAPPAFSRRRGWSRGQAISFLMQQAVENPQVLSLAAGLVDPDSLPVDEARQAMAELLATDSRGREVLQYGTTAGSERLRNLLLDHMARLEGCATDELGIHSNQLMLTTGSQQLLALLTDVLFDPGDICLVAAPTYFVYLGTLHGTGAETIAVKTDADGMCMDALETELERLESEGRLDRVKLIYLVSYYDNPSGRSVSAERRDRVVEIARHWSQKHRIFVLEDAAYRELRYDGEVLPSIWGCDRNHDTVVLTQTFSKTFSPGLRVGYSILPECLVDPICDGKGNQDFGSANFAQHMIATVFELGLYEEHVRKVCQSYRTKRDCMLDAADQFFGDLPGVEWVHPHGGLYVWMSLPEGIDTGFDSRLFHQATKEEQVMYVPGELFFAGPADQRPRNHMRLSYGVQNAEGIQTGMQRLASAVKKVL